MKGELEPIKEATRRLSLAEELAQVIADGANWDVGSLRAKLIDMLRKQKIEGGPMCKEAVSPPDVFPPFWESYRSKPATVKAVKHPDKDAMLVLAASGEITIVAIDKFKTIFEPDR